MFLGAQVSRKVAGKTGQFSAIQLDDARGDVVEKTPVVRDEQHTAVEIIEQPFQPFDGSEVEMVGRFVQDQYIRLGHQRLRQRHALAHPAGQVRYQPLGVELQARERGRDLVLEAPAVARIEFFLQLVQPLHQGGIGGRAGVMRYGEGVRRGVIVDEQAGTLTQPFSHRFEHGQAGLECGLLGYARQLQPRRAPQLPSSATAAPSMSRSRLDLPVPLRPIRPMRSPGSISQIDLIEQRHVTVRQGNLGELNQGHVQPGAETGICP